MTDRQKIVNTAADLYLKFGIKSIRIDDLADELGISKKLFMSILEVKRI